MWTVKIKTFLERLFNRLKKSLGNTNTRIVIKRYETEGSCQCLVSLSKRKHLNFYVVLTYTKKLHNIYLKALHMNRAR